MNEITTPSMFGTDITPVTEPPTTGGLFDTTPELAVAPDAPKPTTNYKPTAPKQALISGLFPIPVPDLTTDGGFDFTTD